MSRKKKHEEAHADERWVISYADLVTLLFGFFLLLYATADANAIKFAQLSKGLAEAFHVPVKDADSAGSIFDGGTGIVPGRNSTSQIEDDLSFIRSIVDRESIVAGIPGQIRVSREDDHIVIRLADQLIFPSASADLRSAALPVLDVVARSVQGLPNELRIEGHTDNVPVGTDRYPSNWELSSARATAVLRYLVEQNGIDASHVFAAGYGSERPIATNLTPEGRALNRRADIVVLYPPVTITGSDGASGTGTQGADPFGESNGTHGAETSSASGSTHAADPATPAATSEGAPGALGATAEPSTDVLPEIAPTTAPDSTSEHGGQE